MMLVKTIGYSILLQSITTQLDIYGLDYLIIKMKEISDGMMGHHLPTETGGKANLEMVMMKTMFTSLEPIWVQLNQPRGMI